MHDHFQSRTVDLQLAHSVRAVLETAPQLGRAARSEAERLGHAVLSLDAYLPGVVGQVVGAASRSQSLPNTQLAYLEHARTLLEATEALVIVCKEAGGNPRVMRMCTR
ncbi:unnamed protein product [Protopolystoma xenopodis]|uniref:Talin 1-like rod-segment domain-containing protein n=1 Tax=Protopolystoma xenopodis TaxID=117903 RepID=A0A3S5BXJ1_9PLAT|nr:unnamed protein product [Protopolystoma xenopodis]